jgi:hypothetical protein
MTEEIIVEPPANDGCITVVPGGCGGSGCADCTFGEGQLAEGCGPNPSFPLSPDRLYINPEAPAADLYKPAGLKVFKATASTDIVLDGNNHVRQVKTADGLVDIGSVTSSGDGYTMNFWTGHGDKVNDLYPTNGAHNVASWTVQKTSDSPLILQLSKENGITLIMSTRTTPGRRVKAAGCVSGPTSQRATPMVIF